MSLEEMRQRVATAANGDAALMAQFARRIVTAAQPHPPPVRAWANILATMIRRDAAQS